MLDLRIDVRLCIMFFLASVPMQALADPLPAWKDTATKQEIISFVDKVTTKGAPEFVPDSERIAVFDNDGTLWAEKPIYFQLLYTIDRVKELAPQHPEWKKQEPFASVLKDDRDGVMQSGKKGLMQMIAATHAGMTVEEFSDSVTKWMAKAKHPQTGKPYTKMIYQPMLELLQYLRSKGFKTFIVSGGGIDFMRPWAEQTYGIPPEQVVGSSLQMKYEIKDGKPVLVKLAEIDHVDDKAGKPVGIERYIGRRPIFAGGNSDGDFEMLEWTTAKEGPSFGLLIHHTDAEREWAYDRDSHVGRLDRALEEAPQRGWTVVDMQADWDQVFVK